MRLNHVYILIGSNVEPQRNVLRALEMMKQWFNVIAVSPIYESAAVGGTADDPPYWNMAVKIETYTILLLLRRKLRTIEHQLGRQRFDLEGERLKTVTVDLDILLFNNEVNRSALEPLPHPDLLERAYASVPLADIAPAMPHPVTGETMGAVAQRLRDGAAIRRLFPTVRVDAEKTTPIELPPGDLQRPEETASAHGSADTVLPGDIPHRLEADSPAPTLETLVTLPDEASELQPPVVTHAPPVPKPTKKRKGKQPSDMAPVSVPPTPAKPPRRKKQV